MHKSNELKNQAEMKVKRIDGWNGEKTATTTASSKTANA